MMSAIDAVCDQASQIIERLTERGGSDMVPAALVARAAQRSARQTSPPRRSGSSETSSPLSRVEPAAGPEPGSPPTRAAKRQRSTKPAAAGAGAVSSGRAPAAPKARAGQTFPDLGPSKRPAPTGNGTTSSADTPLRIPYGNKEAAQALRARYRACGWYAPADVPLAAFREPGWL